MVHAIGPTCRWLWGHRYDWENVVVWLSEETDDPEFLGTAYSGHGDYLSQKHGDHKDNYDGDKPNVYYDTNGITNHQVCPDFVKGGTQPLIDWNALTVADREGLRKRDFSAANVPFIEEHFEDNPEKARF